MPLEQRAEPDEVLPVEKRLRVLPLRLRQARADLNVAQANAKLAGMLLDIGVGTTANGDLVWVCGPAAVPAGVVGAPADASTVTPKWLPSSCR